MAYVIDGLGFLIAKYHVSVFYETLLTVKYFIYQTLGVYKGILHEMYLLSELILTSNKN